MKLQRLFLHRGRKVKSNFKRLVNFPNSPLFKTTFYIKILFKKRQHPEKKYFFIVFQIKFYNFTFNLLIFILWEILFLYTFLLYWVSVCACVVIFLKIVNSEALFFVRVDDTWYTFLFYFPPVFNIMRQIGFDY